MRIEVRESRAHRVYGMSARRRSRGVAGARRRAGFTLVELIVAIMVFAIGMLGLAATAASVTRLMGGAKRQTIAANVAQSRLERLRSSPCATLAGGVDTTRGVVNKWTVQAVTRGVSITDTVFYASTRGSGYRAYKTTLPC